MLMEVTGPERGLQKLENLADKLDGLGPNQYNQRSWMHCALFHHCNESMQMTPEYISQLMDHMVRSDQSLWRHAEKEFGITREEVHNLFTSGGCGDAGADAKKAAAYIRQFVYEKRKEMIK